MESLTLKGRIIIINRKFIYYLFWVQFISEVLSFSPPPYLFQFPSNRQYQFYGGYMVAA